MRKLLLLLSITISLWRTASAQANQTVTNGASTATVTFPGTGCVYNWVNSNPSIGLAASGTGNIASFTAINTGSTPVTATITATPVAAGFAYIANYGSNTVTVINTVTNAVVATIPVGVQPFGVALSPDGTHVFVANVADKTISVIDAATNKVTSAIPLTINPLIMTMSPDGSRLYVSALGQGSLCVLGTSPGFPLLATISIGSDAKSIAVSPDGSTVYATLQLINVVSVINAATNNVSASITLGNGPLGAVVSPDGSRLYVTNYSSSTLSIINTANNTIIGTLPVSGNPWGITISPDGKKVYVSNGSGNSISVINTATNSVALTISSTSNLGGVSLTPDGSLLYVTNFPLKTVSVINTATSSLVTSIPVGTTPYSYGSFISAGIGCKSAPITITITVNPTPQPPLITTTTATGSISACAGSASAAPSVQQFTLSGSNLTADITATAPTGFEVSATAGSGYGATATFSQTAGKVNNATVYVRSAASATAGNISGNVVLSSATATNQNVAVTATVNALPTVNSVANQTVTNGSTTTLVSFTGTANIYTWANNMPGIGLPASGTGNIPSFAAINIGSSPVTATITVTPVSTTGTCTGIPVTFTITINPTVPLIAAGLVVGKISACAGSPSASPAVDRLTVSGVNLTNDITATAPPDFEVSLNPLSGYGTSVTLVQTGSLLNSTVVYVRSAVTAAIGKTTGNLLLTTPGGTSQQVLVSAVVNPLPVVNPVNNQTIVSGKSTTAVSFSGTGNTFLWTNNTPSIGLAASGTGNIASFTAINNGSIPVTATVTAVPFSAGFAYVANSKANTVSVINTTTRVVVATIPVGSDPWGIAIAPDNSKVYITNQNSNNVSVIDTKTSTVTATIAVGKTPVGIAISPDGSSVYVGNQNSATGASISVIDAKTDKVISTLNGGFGPVGLAVSPNGSRLYVANESPSSITVLNIASNTVLSTVLLASTPYGITLSPDGSLIYVANYNASSVSVIDAVKNTVVATIPVGASPFSMSISPDGRQLYVTNTQSGFISVINTATNRVANTINTGLSGGTDITPDGTQVYIVNSLSNTVSVIDIVTGTILSTIPVGATPIAFGSFIISGATCSGPPVTFTITVNPLIPPVITYLGTLSALTTVYGTASTSASFTVSGANMQAGILVTPPTGIEVSTDNITFSGTVTVGAAGNIANTIVYVRLAATTGAGSYPGNVVLSSTNVTSINVALPAGNVTAAALTITAKDNTKVFGTANPVFTVAYSGFVNNDDALNLTTKPTVTTTAKASSPVGQYAIAATGAASFNYTFTYVDGVLTITPAPPQIVIPNTFTPNSDGVNDIWDIPALASYAGCTVEVYSRSGEKVFRSVGYATPWDATYNGLTLPTGTYYYVIDAKNGSRVLSGPVTVLR